MSTPDDFRDSTDIPDRSIPGGGSVLTAIELRTTDDADLVEILVRLRDAGADIVLLECVPNEVGKAITAALEVPVIGIGAGPDVDGQILVLYDLLGITQGRMPRFVKNFMEGATSVPEALALYVQAVKEGKYPAPEHCFS